MRGRRYVLVGDLADAGDRADDVVELTGEVVELFALQLQTRQPCEVGDLLARDARHAAILWGECVWFEPNPMGRVRVPAHGFPSERPGRTVGRRRRQAPTGELYVWRRQSRAVGGRGTTPAGGRWLLVRGSRRQCGGGPLPAARPPREEPRRGLVGRHRRGDEPPLHRIAPEVP